MSVSKRWVLVVVVALVFASAAAFMRNGDFDAPSAGGNEAVTAQHASWVDLANPGRHLSGAMKTPMRAGYGTYIVMFEEAPLAAYRGDVGGIPAPRRDVKAKNGRLRLDVTGPAARAYVSHLRKRQAALNARMGAILGRSVPVKAAMQHAVNAIAVDLSAEEAETIRAIPGVESVEAQMEFETMSDRGAQLIGAVPVWEGSNPGSGGVQYQGEGMVVAVLDSGINFGSPSFAATAPVDGYVHINPLGNGVYLGSCANGGPDIGRCNAKLIGGVDFVCGAPGNFCGDANAREEPGFGDTDGHGTHVASIAAGNLRDLEYFGAPVRISGVAPRANIIAYDTCYSRGFQGGFCPSASMLAAIDHAVATGVVDAINAASNTSLPLSEKSAIELAMLNAVDAGIYVSSARNSQPWVATVGAVTHGRDEFFFRLGVTGPAPVATALTAIRLRDGLYSTRHTQPIPGTTPLKLSPAAGDSQNACSPYPPGKFAGAVVLLLSGSCAQSTMIDNLSAAGAIAIVSPILSISRVTQVTPSSVPVLIIDYNDANALRDFVAANGNVTAAIDYPATPSANIPDSMVYSVSSMSYLLRGTLKPDFSAPGVRILAADAGNTVTGFEGLVGLRDGNSMATASHSGAVLLVRQARPGWSVSEVRSAFALTATEQVTFAADGSLVTPEWTGSGRIRVDRAINAGLVMHQDPADYRAMISTRFAREDSSRFNHAYLANGGCAGVCFFTRTFRNPHPVASTWYLQLEGIDGDVPPMIDVPAGGSVSVRIALRPGFPPQREVYGGLRLTPADASMGALRLPILLRAGTAKTNDFDGDGASDIHWRNALTGQNDLWLMQGTQFKAAYTVYYEPDSSWTVVGSGDFNGDSHADILWRNTTSGHVFFQLMRDGAMLATSSMSAFVPDMSWQIVAIGNFSSDTHTDILWRNSVTGKNDIWPVYDGNTAFPQQHYFEPNSAWKIKGAGDFDGDGLDELFWRNEADGRNYIMRTKYDMYTGYSADNGASGYVFRVQDQAWQIAAINDFDGDGRADIYWRNRETGFNDLWLMQGIAVKAVDTVYYEPDQNWRIVNSGDYNADGYADLLWRNAQTGDNYMMLMRGTDVLPGSSMLFRVSDLSWRVTGLIGSN